MQTQSMYLMEVGRVKAPIYGSEHQIFAGHICRATSNKFDIACISPGTSTKYGQKSVPARLQLSHSQRSQMVLAIPRSQLQIQSQMFGTMTKLESNVVVTIGKFGFWTDVVDRWCCVWE